MDTIKDLTSKYAHMYFPVEKKEGADGSTTFAINYLQMIIQWLVSGFAIYLSFRCNYGFKLGSFILALCCAPCYIIYHLATSNLCGLIQ